MGDIATEHKQKVISGKFDHTLDLTLSGLNGTYHDDT